MSSSELQGTSRKRLNNSSEIDSNAAILNSSIGRKKIKTRIQHSEQQSGSSNEISKEDEELTPSVPASSATQPAVSTIEIYKQLFLRVDRLKRMNDFLSFTGFNWSESYDKLDNENILDSIRKKDVFLQPAPVTKKTAEDSSIPFKNFPPGLFKLPLKKKLAASMSLEESCRFLPYLIKSKWTDLKGMEQQLKYISTELQKAMMDTNMICIKLESSSETVTTNMSKLVVRAKKLMYLLSSSFRIFEKLVRCGSALKESLQAYSQDATDYHLSVDTILEHMMETIKTDLYKLKQLKSNS